MILIKWTMSQSFEFMVIVLIESNSEALKKHIICINPFVKKTIKSLKIQSRFGPNNRLL